MIIAELKNYRQSPKKVRLVVDAIRGKKVADAMDMLTLTTQRSAMPMRKLLQSAVANARHNHNVTNVDGLYITEIRVDSGITYHRMMPRARGSSAPIQKRCSHIKIILDTKDKKAEVKAEAKTEAPEAKKPVAKKASTKKAVTKAKK